MFTLFLPGLESGDPAVMPRLPALERLLARGRGRPLEDSPWAYLAGLAGGSLARWPVGPTSALGELALAAPRACLRVEPLGAAPERQAVFRLPASSLQIGRGEAGALASAFHEAFAGEGLRLELATPERWYLAWQENHPKSRDWRGFSEPMRALGREERPAPPEGDLRLLLSEIEMLFYAHPVNVARRERGVATIAGLHPWGGGVVRERAAEAVAGGDAVHEPGGPELPEEPYLAGLRRLGVVPGAAAREYAPGRGSRSGSGSGPGWAPGRAGLAWPLALETLALEQVAELDRAWGAPLLAALRRGRLAGVRIVTGRMIHETRPLDALRVWRRPRPLAEPW